MTCDHDKITADLMEGDGDGRGIQWCQRCGSYRRTFLRDGTLHKGDWNEPEGVVTEEPEGGMEVNNETEPARDVIAELLLRILIVLCMTLSTLCLYHIDDNIKRMADRLDQVQVKWENGGQPEQVVK